MRFSVSIWLIVERPGVEPLCSGHCLLNKASLVLDSRIWGKHFSWHWKEGNASVIIAVPSVPFTFLCKRVRWCPFSNPLEHLHWSTLCWRSVLAIRCNKLLRLSTSPSVCDICLEPSQFLLFVWLQQLPVSLEVLEWNVLRISIFTDMRQKQWHAIFSKRGINNKANSSWICVICHLIVATPL